MKKILITALLLGVVAVLSLGALVWKQPPCPGPDSLPTRDRPNGVYVRDSDLPKSLVLLRAGEVADLILSDRTVKGFVELRNFNFWGPSKAFRIIRFNTAGSNDPCDPHWSEIRGIVPIGKTTSQNIEAEPEEIADWNRQHQGSAVSSLSSGTDLTPFWIGIALLAIFSLWRVKPRTNPA